MNSNGEPHVVPVAFRYNDEIDAIDVGGHNFAKSKKYRDVRRNGRARGVEVRGSAEVLGTGGEEIGPGFDEDMIRIFADRIVSWGIDSDAFSRSVGRTA